MFFSVKRITFIIVIVFVVFIFHGVSLGRGVKSKEYYKKLERIKELSGVYVTINSGWTGLYLHLENANNYPVDVIVNISNRHGYCDESRSYSIHVDANKTKRADFYYCSNNEAPGYPKLDWTIQSVNGGEPEIDSGGMVAEYNSGVKAFSSNVEDSVLNVPWGSSIEKVIKSLPGSRLNVLGGEKSSVNVVFEKNFRFYNCLFKQAVFYFNSESQLYWVLCVPEDDYKGKVCDCVMAKYDWPEHTQITKEGNKTRRLADCYWWKSNVLIQVKTVNWLSLRNLNYMDSPEKDVKESLWKPKRIINKFFK